MTKKIYLQDSYLFEFDSPILDTRKREDYIEIVLESTAFYPESGGQLYDTGSLNGYPVTKVYENEAGEVIHCIPNDPASGGNDFAKKAGDSVHGKIYAARRLDNMRKHTGQHILSKALIDVARAETVSSRLGEIESTIELSRESIDNEMIDKAEHLANEIIMNDQPIDINYYDRDELGRLPIRKIPDREGKFRIVQIGEFDYTACGGTHCRRSGEVGLIKIIGQEKLRGHTRLIFLAGRQALSDYALKHQQLSALSGLLTCHFLDLDKSVNKLLEQNASLRRELTLLNGQMLALELGELITAAPETAGIKIAFKEYKNQELKILREAAAKAIESNRAIVFLTVDDKILLVVSKGIKPDAAELAKAIMEKFGGKGGGGPLSAQIGGISPIEPDKILELIRELTSGK